MIIDPTDPRLAAAGFVIQMGEKDATIHRLDESGAPLAAWAARAAIQDGKLSFYPQRSASQRDVLRAMGIAVDDPSFG